MVEISVWSDIPRSALTGSLLDSIEELKRRYKRVFISGFKRNKGTRESILALRLIIEDEIRANKPTHVTFVDFLKAFDNVEWNEMFKIIKSAGITLTNLRVIYHSLYEEQRGVMGTDEEAKVVIIGIVVQQGYTPSPLIFSPYV